MKDTDIKYEIWHLNDDISRMISSEKVNNLQLLTYHNDAKLSVTLTPYKTIKSYETRYHGLHPSFGFNELKEFLCSRTNKDIINNSDVFWKSIEHLQQKHNYMDLMVCFWQV